MSPSLAFESPLDYQIKSNLIVDALNIVGLRKFVRKGRDNAKNIKFKQTSLSSNTTAAVGAKQADKKKRYPSALNMSKFEVGQSSGGGVNLNRTENHGNGPLPLGSLKEQFEYEGIDVNLLDKLSRVTVKHREILKDALEEFARNKKRNFTRVYPAPGSNYYDQFFEQTRHINKMMYKLLYQPSEVSEILVSLY